MDILVTIPVQIGIYMTDIHFRTHCGYEVVDDTLVLKVEPQHLNAGGIVHGGLTATMLDHVGGMAVKPSKDNRWVTINLNVNYLGMGKLGDTLTATANPIRLGASVAVINCELRNQDGNLVGSATATFKKL